MRDLLDFYTNAPLLELGMESTDGTGATLAWSLLRSAAALLTEVAEGEEAGPTQPVPIAPPAEAQGAAGSPTTGGSPPSRF